MTQRDTSLDMMRFLGVLIVVIAHSGPPSWLFQLRNFGTPLLIVASALTYSAIYKSRNIEVWEFYRKRLARLIVPAWIFLTIFFISAYLVSSILDVRYPFSGEQIFTSYTFYSGIGYVWILRVYLILALITPIALRFKNSTESTTNYFLILLLAYIFYESALPHFQSMISENHLNFFNNVVFTIIPYSILFLYGLRLDEVSTRRVLQISVLSMTVFAFLAIYYYLEVGKFVKTQSYKYPPQLYYLSYSILCLNMTYLLCKTILVKLIPPKSVVWLSANSLWIYLWHIMAVYLLKYTVGSTQGRLGLFLVKCAFILFFSVSITMVQKFLVRKFVERSDNRVVPEQSNVEKLVLDPYLAAYSLPQEDHHDTEDTSEGEVFPIDMPESPGYAAPLSRQRQQ